jgi:hypothetical protein
VQAEIRQRFSDFEPDAGKFQFEGAHFRRDNAAKAI